MSDDDAYEAVEALLECNAQLFAHNDALEDQLRAKIKRVGELEDTCRALEENFAAKLEKRDEMIEFLLERNKQYEIIHKSVSKTKTGEWKAIQRQHSSAQLRNLKTMVKRLRSDLNDIKSTTVFALKSMQDTFLKITQSIQKSGSKPRSIPAIPFVPTKVLPARDVHVLCRIRPSTTPSSSCGLQLFNGQSILAHSRSGSRLFGFDHCFHEKDDTSSVFSSLQDKLPRVLQGENSCFLAYGQTASGKTYTMTEIEHRSVSYLLRLVEQSSHRFTLSMSVVEVYQDTVIDLLSNDKRASVCMSPLRTSESFQRVSFSSLPGFEASRSFAESKRTIGANHCNERSSRSHFIVSINVASSFGTGRLALVDLAGSERVTSGTQRSIQETQSINKSLSSLSTVLNAIRQQRQHVPFRDSKLTYFLQPFLTRSPLSPVSVVLLCHVSPEAADSGESLCTLRFGSCMRGAALAHEATPSSEKRSKRELLQENWLLQAKLFEAGADLEALRMRKGIDDGDNPTLNNGSNSC